MSAPLDVSRIAYAGLAVLDRDGAAGLTIRAVAAELGVTPMAIYHHVEDKQALVAAILETAQRERPMPGASRLGWQQDLWNMAAWMFQGAAERPALMEINSANSIVTPSMLPIGERWVGLWQQSDLPRDVAFEAAVASLAGITSSLRLALPPNATAMDLSWHPDLRDAMAGVEGGIVQFELIARSLIEGLYARLSHSLTTISRT